MKHIKLCVLAALIEVTAAPVFAQTAEETVAFFLFGLEDGRLVGTKNGPVEVKKTDGEHASYAVVDADRLHSSKIASATIVQASKCNFNVEAKRSGGERIQLKIDFSKFIDVSDVGVDDPILVYKFGSGCAVQADAKCSSQYLTVLSEMTPPFDRLNNSIDYFRRNFCSGAAF